MKYYKHMSNMVHDVKVRRVISKYGLRGYGLYNFILESITANIEDDRPLPILEEASTDIAELFNEDTAKIEEMIWFFINQGLIEQEEIEGKLLCTKVYRYLQQSETRSKKIRDLIKSYKIETSEAVPYCYIMKGEGRYKIGKSGNIDIRRRELSIEHGEELELVAYIRVKDAIFVESRLHKEYKHKNITGKWFELTDEELDKIINNYSFQRVTNVSDRFEEEKRIEEKRREENSTERVTKISHPTLSLPLGATRWQRITTEYGEKVCNAFLDKIIRWEDAKNGGKRKYKDYAAACEDWLIRDKVAPLPKETPGMIDVSEIGKNHERG